MMNPIIRFKRDDGSDFPDWEQKELGQVLTEDLYPVSNPEGAYTKLAIRSHGKGTFDKHIEAGESLDVDKMFEVKADRVLLNITFAWELAIAITSERDEGKLVSHRFPQYKIDGDAQFYKYHLINERMRYDLGVASPGGAGRNRVLNKKDFMKIKKNIPCLEEQQKIASFFADIDEVIAQSEAEVAALEKQKKGAMQKIFSQEVRFKMDDGSDYPEWEEKKLGECLKYEQPTKYIVKSDDYNGKSTYPVLTANKGFILGFTDETEGVYDKGDVVIFDDFTCDMKYVDFSFKVKSSAMKMLSSVNNNDSLKCLYEILRNLNYKPSSHQRHWISVFSEMYVLIPCIAEQQKIADFLSDFDTAIDLAKQELERWKLLKKGLMQQMFV